MQEGGIAGFCDRIEVARDGLIHYTANCKGKDSTGKVPDSLFAQLQALATRLAPINNVSQDNPGGADNMKTTIVLTGSGTAQASPSDLEALAQLGQVLHNFDCQIEQGPLA